MPSGLEVSNITSPLYPIFFCIISDNFFIDVSLPVPILRKPTPLVSDRHSSFFSFNTAIIDYEWGNGN